MQYYLGVDIGTSGTKTALFDVQGSLVASCSAEYPLSQPQNGYAEQMPQDWANAVLHTMAAVMEKSGTALMGAGEGRGENRARQAIEAATTSVLLNDNDISGAKNILLYFFYILS